MRKIAANYIYPVTSAPIKNGVLLLDEQGGILDIIDRQGGLKEIAGLEFYNGIIIPGFINAHCHLELSHLKNSIPEKKGMAEFIKHLLEKRDAEQDRILHAMKQADEEMFRSGIHVVGDISNTSNTITRKIESPIYYHTFVEVLGLDDNKVDEILANAVSLKHSFEQQHLPASITPHAPYSLSEKLFESIQKEIYENGIFSIHNQESKQELELFTKNSGELYDLFKSMGFPTQNIISKSISSLLSLHEYLPKKAKKLLVHNTYTRLEEIEKTENVFRKDDIFWILCPRSNMFIENRLPDIPVFHENNSNIALGTDSLASNQGLCIFKEMQTIIQHFPQVPFEEILSWATIMGAKALQVDDRFGSLEAGKNPGILLVENFDFERKTIKQDSTIKRLV